MLRFHLDRPVRNLERVLMVCLAISTAMVGTLSWRLSAQAPSIVTLSSAFVFFTKGTQGTIALSSADAVKGALTDEFCGGKKGATTYEGHFTLSFQDQHLALGKMWFAQGTYHDGGLIVRKLDPNSDQDFVILLLYASCNGERARFYGYGQVRRRIIQYSFRHRNGNLSNEIMVTPYGGVPPFIEISPSRAFTSRWYDNVSGKTLVSKWRFNAAAQIFDEIGQ